MSNFFNHTPQKIGATTSPVSDLALEVSDAFSKVGGLLNTEGTTIQSFKDVLGNALLSNLKAHKVSKDSSETHTLFYKQSDIVLENKPNKEDILLSYFDTVSGLTQNLTLIENNLDFTTVNQYKILGKVLRLNVRIPKGSALTLTAVYSTTTFDLAGSKFLPNVFKKEDGEFLIVPTGFNENSVILNYETNLSDSINQRVNNPQEALNFYYTYDRKNFTKLECDSYSIEGSVIRLVGNYLPLNKVNLEVLAYVSNTSLSELVDALVYEFLNHDHSNTNITPNISHKDITNRFVNTDKLSYKESDIVNYEHPQYLNREGYNGDLDAVYENSFVGDFFISRVIDNAVQKFKGLDADSYKIMFGDPILGHTLHYKVEDKALILSSFQNLNGLNIKVNSNQNYALKLNGSVFKSSIGEGLHIQPEDSTLDITSASSVPNVVKIDTLRANTSNLETINANKIVINNIEISKSLDNKSAVVSSKGLTPEDKGVFRLEAEVIADKITVNVLESNGKVIFNEIDSHKINFKDISLVDTIEENLLISSKTNKALIIKALTKIDNLEVEVLKVKSFGLGDLVFSGSDTNDVVISGETKKLIITALTQINTLTSDIIESNTIKVNELVAVSSKLNSVESNSIKFGEVLFSKTLQDNLIVSSLSNKVIFDLLVEANDLVALKLSSPKANLEEIVTKKLVMGAIEIGINSDPLNNGIVVLNTQPDSSTILFNSPTIFTKVTSDDNILRKVTASILNIGNISLFKTLENNLTIAGIDNKVLFTTKAEFVNIKSDLITATDSFLDKVNIGKVLLAKTVNNDLAITSELNKLLVTAPTIIKTLTAETLVAPISTLDVITSQQVKLGKVTLANSTENLVVTAEEGFKVDFLAPVEIVNLEVDNLTSNNTNANSITTTKLDIGGVTLGHSEALDLIIDSSTNKVSVQAPMEVLNLTTNSIVSEAITAGVNTLDTIINRVFNIGGVSFNKTLEDNVEVSSLANKIRFNLPVEFTNVSSFDTSLMNLHTLNASLINIGNLTLGETDSGNIKVSVTKGANPENSLDIASKLISRVFQPYEIRGENAHGFLNDIEINTLKIGNSSIVNYEGKTIIHPKTPEVDKLIINTKTEIGKLASDSVVIQEGTLTKATINELKIGGVTLKNSALEGTTVTGDNSDNLLDFKVNAKFEGITSNKVKTNTLNSESIVTTSSKIGSILFIKDPSSNSARLQKTDIDSMLYVDVPTVLANASIGNLEATGQADFESLKTKYLDLGGFIFKKDVDEATLVLDNVSKSTLRIETPLLAKKFVAEVFSAYNYTFYNNDKISIDSENYLGNSNNRFQFVNNKPISFVGSSKDSGIALVHEEGARASMRAYVAANSGANAVVTEKNIFIETDTTKGTYLIEPTTSKRTKDGVVYGFNDTTAQVNISDLTKWFRSDLAIGELEAYSGEFMVNEGQKKNGIRIGSTRISVTGVETDCPPGLTIFESQDTINIVKPLSVNQEGCRDVIYQSLNTGPLSVEGSSSIDGTLSITEDLVINGAIGATDLSLNGDLEVIDAVINGDLEVKGAASFNSKILFKNDIELSNDLVAIGRMKARSLEVREDIVVGKSLQVLENMTAEQELTVKGTLNLKSDLDSDGRIKAAEMSTEFLTVQNIKLIRNLESSGSAVFQGDLHSKSNSTVDGNLSVNTSLNVKESATVQDLYVLRDAIIKEKLVASNGAEIQGKIITIGREGSNVTLAGKLQFDTTEVKFNSPVSVYESFRVTGNLLALGEISNKGGISTDSSLYVKGTISCESTIETDSNVVAKSIEVKRNLTVDNSITGNNISTISLNVDTTATVANLNISKSLSMPIDTSIVAGDVKFGSITQTQPSSLNSFAGDMSLSGNLEVLKGLEINQDLKFSDKVILNSNGFKGLDAKIEVDRIVASTFLGSETIQTPNHVAVSRNAGALALGSLIPSRKFARIDHLVCDSIAVFNQSLTADTIYYKELVFAGSPNDDIAGSVNIIARKALYA